MSDEYEYRVDGYPCIKRLVIEHDQLANVLKGNATLDDGLPDDLRIAHVVKTDQSVEYGQLVLEIESEEFDPIENTDDIPTVRLQPVPVLTVAD